MNFYESIDFKRRDFDDLTAYISCFTPFLAEKKGLYKIDMVCLHCTANDELLDPDRLVLSPLSL